MCADGCASQLDKFRDKTEKAGWMNGWGRRGFERNKPKRQQANENETKKRTIRNRHFGRNNKTEGKGSAVPTEAKLREREKEGVSRWVAKKQIVQRQRDRQTTSTNKV